MRRDQVAMAAIVTLLLVMIAGLTYAQGPSPESSTETQAALGTAFTYQGRLTDDGETVDGTCDLSFKLYDEAGSGTPPTGGTLLDTVEKPKQEVVEGLITVQLDFGGGVFKGDARWLEIGVDCGDGAVTLSPRQLLTPAPYALALPGLWTEQDETSPNVIGGHRSNSTLSGVAGAVIGGGGESEDANQVTENFGVVAGGRGNVVSGYEATISGGDHNIASSVNATVGGGEGNTASGAVATIGGGDHNIASDGNATVGGGRDNQASGYAATISGGYDNSASGWHATVSGGLSNSAVFTFTIISGGEDNRAEGLHTTVSGGGENTARGWRSTVGGGHNNTAHGYDTTIGGGSFNRANDWHATIAGGENNVADGWAAAVSGGHSNTASAWGATVSGGLTNTVSSWCSTVGGGNNNVVISPDAVIGGGENNTVENGFGTVGGGNSNRVSGANGTVGGGHFNTASGLGSTIPGGRENAADGDYSFAAGRRAKANNDGCFVWGDSTEADVACTGDNRWVARASGGVYFYSSADLSTGVHLPAGSSEWLPIPGFSDRNLKDHIIPVDTQGVLGRLAEPPISTWSYKSSDRVRHIGPMAQDFYATFGLGDDDKRIHTIDTAGVALASIQGLYNVVQEKEMRISELEADNAALQSQVDDLEARVQALEELVLKDARNEGRAQLEFPFDWALGAGFLLGGFVLWQRRKEGSTS